MDSSRTNRANSIFEDLRRQILSGELGIDERLAPERELALRYGTNRNTLREAMRKLEQTGLVSVRHGQGVTVTDYRQTGTLALLGPFLEHNRNVSEQVHVLLDLLLSRAQVLELAVRLVAERASTDDVAHLQSLAEAQISFFEAGDRGAVARGDLDFVDALLDAAHSLTIRWIANTFLEISRALVERFPALWVLEPAYPTFLNELVEAVRTGDAEGAARVTKTFFNHADATLADMFKGLVAGPNPKSFRARPTPPKER